MDKFLEKETDAELNERYVVMRLEKQREEKLWKTLESAAKSVRVDIEKDFKDPFLARVEIVCRIEKALEYVSALTTDAENKTLWDSFGIRFRAPGLHSSKVAVKVRTQNSPVGDVLYVEPSVIGAFDFSVTNSFYMPRTPTNVANQVLAELDAAATFVAALPEIVRIMDEHSKKKADDIDNNCEYAESVLAKLEET